MNKQYLASICSILVIVAIVAWNVHGANSITWRPSTLGGNAYQVAIAEGAPVTYEPLAPLAVTAQANGGTLPFGTTITLDGTVMRYYTESGSPALLQAIAIELPGSAAARGATFTVAHSTSADWAADGAGSPLAATQSDDGTWYTLVDAAQLSLLHKNGGTGWYVFTGVATRGDEREQSIIAFYVQ